MSLNQISQPTYRVRFNISHVNHIITIRTIDDVKHGFWVNNDYEWTNGDDAMYYVMPHMIKSIQKVLK